MFDEKKEKFPCSFVLDSIVPYVFVQVVNFFIIFFLLHNACICDVEHDWPKR